MPNRAASFTLLAPLALLCFGSSSCAHRTASESAQRTVALDKPVAAVRPGCPVTATAKLPAAPAVVNNQTLHGLLVMGYQGWFTYPGAPPAMEKWVHWFRHDEPTAENVRIDMWPDLCEFPPEELRDTELTYPDGRVAGLYSAANLATVDRHMRWAREYGIDGVFLQRFIGSVTSSKAQAAFRNKVTENIKAAAEAHGRVFAIEYDTSGANAETLVDDLKQDWRFLVDKLGVTASDRYLWHRGRPLLVIWGLGFANRPATAAQANELIDWFTRDAPEKYRVTLAGGVPSRWRTLSVDSRTDPEWASVYRRFSVIHPWHVNRFKNDKKRQEFFASVVADDLAEVKRLGIDYLPVVFPGFSWTNMKYEGSLERINETPRRGGDFWWGQFHQYASIGCDMIFGAMFDEVDEATAMFKVATSKANVPVEVGFVTLDIDGFKMSSDFYLRLAGAAGRVLRKEAPLTREVPIPLELP